MKPVAIDLFCGKGGWTNALLEQGFTVYGFDIETQPEYKGIFVQCDILALTADDLRQYAASFATCPSPCEQFSVHGMRHFHPNPKYPEMGIKLFNHSRALLEFLDIPYVMENVRAAQAFIGKSVNHCGPFYLWGSGVPAVMPAELYRIQKGMTRKALGYREFKGESGWNTKNEKSIDRGTAYECAAVAGMIPLPIARAVAEVARTLALEAA